MFNEAETLKWVNAYREEFGLPLLDQLPAGQKMAGSNACMMGRATPGLSWQDEPYLYIGDSGNGEMLALPEVAIDAEQAFERNELPESYYHGDAEITVQADEEAREIFERMTPEVIDRLQAKLSDKAWEPA